MRTSFHSLSLALAGICLFGPQIVPAQAAAYSWLGNGSSDAWTNLDGNWDGGSYPGAFGTTDTALFPSSASPRNDVTIDAGILSIASITFDRAGYSLWLRSGTLVTSGGIAATTANAADWTVDSSLGLGGNATVRNLTGSGTIYQFGSSSVGLNVVGPASTFSGSIEDGIALNVGDGTQTASLTLNRHATRANTYTGTTTVRANATLATGTADALAAGSEHVINGTLNLAGGSATVGGLSGSGAVTLGGKNLTVNGGGTFGGVISGAGTLIKTGTGAFTITGFAEQTGNPNTLATVIRGGSLSVTGGTINHENAETMVGWMSGDDGALMIRDNSTVTNDDGFIGYGAGSTGEALVDGGRWDNFGDLGVGQNGTGKLTIQAGGIVTSRNSFVGAAQGSSGTAEVNGGTWTSTLSLGVGSIGSGTLTISNASEVTSRTGHVGEGPDSVGTVNINSGTWNTGLGQPVSNSLFVGIQGTGTLNVANDGLLTSAATSIGDLPGGNGTVNINGGMWSSVYYTVVGNGGTGTLNISNGGQVTNDYAILGFSGEGTVTVDNAIWNSTNLIVSQHGKGTLNIQNGAAVSATGIVMLADDDIGVGTLNIGAYNTPTTAGTLSVAEVTFGYGAGVINFNQTDAVNFSPDITGDNGTIVQRGSGTTTLTGANTYTGTTTVERGTLVAASSQSLGGSSVQVKGGTLLIESGVNISNDVTLAGGTLAQKFAAGTQLSTVRAYKGAVSGGIATGAKLLGGATSANTTLTGKFSATSPALNDGNRISDVFSFNGVPVVNIATGETDIFVLQLSVANINTASYLGWLDPETNTWVNAVNGNFGGTAFFAGDRAYTPGDFQLGYYGVDTANGTVWAVLNHNSSFAAIPEPSTWALLGMGFVTLAMLRRRHAKA